MNVSVVCDVIQEANPNHYGSEAQYVYFTEALLRQGHTVDFFAAEGSTPVGNHHFYQNAKGDVPRAVQIETQMINENMKTLLDSDLVIDLTSILSVVVDFTLKKRKLNGVALWSLNGMLPTIAWHPSPFVRKVFHGVFISEFQRRVGIEQGGQIANMTHVIPLGIDINRYKPVSNPTRDYLLYCSRPHPDKGIYSFIRYASMFPNEKFVMAFDMEFSDHKMHGKQALQMAEGVPNIEYVPLNNSFDKKVEMMANAKALFLPLNPSYQEAMGLIFLESLSCGTPVITSNYGGQVEMLPDDVAFKVDFADYREAIKNVDKLNTKRCREVILEKHTSDIWANSYIKLAKELKGKEV